MWRHERRISCIIVIPFKISTALNYADSSSSMIRVRNSKFRCMGVKWKSIIKNMSGYGSLAFACAHPPFYRSLGFWGFQITTLIQILLLLIAIYATIAGMNWPKSSRSTRWDPMLIREVICLTKDIFYSQGRLRLAEVDVGWPDHQMVRIISSNFNWGVEPQR